VRGARHVTGNSRTAVHIARVLHAEAPRREDPHLQERVGRRAQGRRGHQHGRSRNHARHGL